MNEAPLFSLLTQYNLGYDLHHHEAIFNFEEGDRVCAMIPGPHGKNLFLRDEKKSFFLLSTFPQKRVDLKALARTLPTSRFSFANTEQLLDQLKLTPGSVTPYGLIHDQNKEITFLLDQDFLNHEIVNFHPLRNDMTISVRLQAFLEFFKRIQHVPKIIKVPVL